MTNDTANLPAPLPPGPPEIEVETVGTALQAPESGPNAPPPEAPAAPTPRSPGMIMLALFAALLALASALYFTRARPPSPADAAAGSGAAPVTIELPIGAPPAAAGAHESPSSDNSSPANPSPDKIFNDPGSFKESLTDARPASAAPDGSVTELPPAPHALPDGASANDALRDAAKAASRGAPPPDDPKADESAAPDSQLLDPEASLPVTQSPAFAKIRNDARRALAFAALAAKARAGEPFAAELNAYLSNDLDAPLSAAIAAHAATGISTTAMLSHQFPGYGAKALAAGRRAEAKGPAARLGASLASLVNLRPAGPAQGSTSAAILSRAEAAVASGDLASALAELRALNPDAVAALAPWMHDASARFALEDALAAREQALYASLDSGQSGR